MKTLSMSNISVEAQATHVAAVTQIQHHQQLNHLANSNTCAKMEHQELQENLESLPDIQEMVEIQEDIVSIPKEIILISLVSQEQALYNPKHEHYRNTQRKDVKWMDIAESVGWAETQCKAKWKAMRDQYCRELKRSKFNAKANVKWKYFKELDFLRPFALSRNYRPRNSANSNNRSSSVSNNNNNSITVHPNATMINATQNNIQDDKKYPNIKIEAGQFNPTEFVTAAQLKTEHRLLSSLTNNQLNVMQQQQSQQQDGTWNYITTTAAAAAAVVLSRSNNEIQIKTSCSGSNNTSNNSMHTTTTTTTAPTVSDEALYNSFVAQIAQQQQNMLVTAAGQMQQQQQNHHINPDEEDDDPIHTFLNIESYFEKELIAIIQQEDILYNNFHPNYRNVKMKLEVWDEIARKLKKTVKQCRLKWKALRDQYIREHKRLKSRENSESLPRWKHYDALSFLQKYIKHKSGDLDKTLIEIPKTEIDIDMKEPCLHSPKLSPLHVASDLHQQQQQHMQQLQQHGLPSLSGPHNVNNNNNNNSTQVQNTLQQQLQHSLHQQQHQPQHQQQHQQQQQLLQHTHHHNQHQVADEHDEAMCAVACGDVSAYDDMDINDYIIGDGDDGVEDHDGGGRVGVVGGGGPNDDGDTIEDDDEDIDRKSEHFPVYSPPVESTVNSNDDHDDDIEMKQQQQQQQQQHHQHIVTSFKTSHDGSLTSQAQTSNSHSLSQQSAALQQHLQQHHLLQSRQQQQQQQHIVNLSNDETAQTQGQSDHDFTDSLHTSLLNGNVTNATTTTTTTAASVNEVAGFVAGLMSGGGAETSVNAAAATAGYSLATASADDDEVGAFFKAVAMKIRNAKMSPVDFTDLQIDILRLINGTLKNH